MIKDRNGEVKCLADGLHRASSWQSLGPCSLSSVEAEWTWQLSFRCQPYIRGSHAQSVILCPHCSPEQADSSGADPRMVSGSMPLLSCSRPALACSALFPFRAGSSQPGSFGITSALGDTEPRWGCSWGPGRGLESWDGDRQRRLKPQVKECSGKVHSPSWNHLDIFSLFKM